MHILIEICEFVNNLLNYLSGNRRFALKVRRRPLIFFVCTTESVCSLCVSPLAAAAAAVMQVVTSLLLQTQQ